MVAFFSQFSQFPTNNFILQENKDQLPTFKEENNINRYIPHQFKHKRSTVNFFSSALISQRFEKEKSAIKK